MKAHLLLKKAYSDLPAITKKMSTSDAQAAEKYLSAIAERAAAMAEYIGVSCGTSGCGRHEHKDALKEMNKTLKRVRAAMGYTITHPINF